MDGKATVCVIEIAEGGVICVRSGRTCVEDVRAGLGVDQYKRAICGRWFDSDTGGNKIEIIGSECDGAMGTRRKYEMDQVRVQVREWQAKDHESTDDHGYKNPCKNQSNRTEGTKVPGHTTVQV
jgi:hypothetical protein